MERGFGVGGGAEGRKSPRFATPHEKAPERGLRGPPTSGHGGGFCEPGQSLVLGGAWRPQEMGAPDRGGPWRLRAGVAGSVADELPASGI